MQGRSFARRVYCLSPSIFLENAELRKLVKLSEVTYGGFVSAVQVNFHVNGESFHDQHRDAPRTSYMDSKPCGAYATVRPQGIWKIGP